ncbi:MAG: aldo/keto reductase [Hyalangium sp.]|uniref:aldo/keto reductase n=1 Tax=Hyalangium sp. TaxID=2028555 RepID=UPI00389AFAAB
MKYRLLGRSGLRVSELCLGTMTFGEDWGWGASPDESRRMFDAFVAQGGNFIDTAVNYTNGSSERLVGEFLSSERDRFVLATKYSLSRRPEDPNASGNHRKNMMSSVETSLRALKTDYIDLYWLHAWDFLTPVDEVMRGLDDLVRSGKVRYVGVSDTPAWVVAQANTLAELRGWTRFVGLQIEYSLVQRTVERELLPMARALELAVTPWGALGGGVLAGKTTPQAEDSKRAANNQGRQTERAVAIAEEVKKVASEVGRSPSQVSLAWVRQQPGIIVPILGARTLRQLQDNLSSLELTLAPEHLSRLDKVSAVDLGFPHEFLRRDFIRQVIYGQHANNIVNHRP